jgi:GNAT superfamily N-acetyltransferase
MTITVRKAAVPELPWANARYAEVDFVPSTHDDLLMIAEIDGAPAGMGRVVPLGECKGELGGMVVFPEYRNLGVARRIVESLQASTDCRMLYCLPFSELEAFYCSLGFAPLTNTADVPQAVLDKHRWCNEHYDKPVSLLVR